MLKVLAVVGAGFAAANVQIPTKEVAPGVNLPYVSIGTWTEGTKKSDLNVSAIIDNWMDLGAVGIDTAWVYFTQKDIAKALEARGADRKKLFITTKIPTCLGSFATRKFIDSNLKSLNTDYIDLLLIHAPGLPGPLGGCDSTWKVMEEYHAKGALKALGVSNWGPKDFEKLKSTIKPAVNQIQFNVFSHDDATEQYCKQNNITVMAWSPLGDPGRSKTHRSVFSDPNVTAIAHKHNVSQAQVALGWIVQKGYPLAVLSTSKEHQANDADLFSFKLDSDDFSILDHIKDSKTSIEALLRTNVKIPTKEVAPGVNLPYVSIGTWTEGTKKSDLNVSAIIDNWMDLGAVGIDTAWIYFTQKDIAKALEARGADRKKLFITTKIPTCLGSFATRKFIDSNLKSLNTDYIDLLLIHAPGLPGPLGGCDSTWKVMEEYHAKGALKALGVSNWGPKDFEKLKFTIKPAVNQIQFNVFSHDDATEQYCKQNNITVMAWSPLGDPGRSKTHRSVFSDPNVTAIAHKHNVSQAQVALGWIVQKGYPLAVLSTSKEHQANDADLFSFKLDSDDFSILDHIKDPKTANEIII